MYLNTTVKIPAVRGKIFKKKKGNATYVLYQYGSEYKQEKKYAVPLRVIIGKISPDDPTLMIPNEKYQIYFPENEISDELPYAYRSCCLKIGTYVIIQKVFDEYKLQPMLRKQFGGDTGLILDLITYLIIEEENSGRYYTDYAFTHPLFADKMTIYSESQVRKMLGSITKDQYNSFLKDWNKKQDHNSHIYISYDSTDNNNDAGEIGILSVAMDKTNRIPLIYEECPGSVIDVSQFALMADKITENGYKKIGFILDHGFFNKENIQYMDEHGYSFIIMCKGRKDRNDRNDHNDRNDRNDLVSSLITKYRASFETKRESGLHTNKVYGVTVATKLYEDDKANRYFHIYYNPAKQAAEREHLEQKIEKMRQHLDKHINKDHAFGKTYQNYFDLHYDKKGKLVGFDERTDDIEKELKLCGFFCIITSDKMKASQALALYKGKDESGKLFHADKTFIGSGREELCSSQCISSKIFIKFLAMIVRNRIYNLLRDQMLRMESKQRYMTVPTAIRELEKIEMVRRNGASYKLDHAVTNPQKMILRAFGLDEIAISKKAEEISRQLITSQSLMNKEEPDDDNS